VRRVTIVLRTCDRERESRRPSRLGYTKPEVLRLCLSSLARSIRECPHPVRLFIADDHSAPETRLMCRELLQGIDASWSTIAGAGNADSVRYVFEFARESLDGLIYFVEDDYLHAPSAVEEIITFHRWRQEQPASAWGGSVYLQSSEAVIHPCDDPDRYGEENAVPSFVVAGPRRHWRTVRKTTFTFAVEHRTLVRFWSCYERAFHLVVERFSINPIYDHIPCFAPIPSLAVHLQTKWTLSPHVDWRSWMR
jgi:hypothetical protein